MFVQPRRHERPVREQRIVDLAARHAVQHKDKTIAVYEWSAPSTQGEVPEPEAESIPTALLVHGWEGRGSQLSAFVEPLLALGFRVIAFDHVGHGESDGRACSLPTMRDTLRAVAAATCEGGAPSALIAHSMGSFAASLALAEGWRSTTVVYVSPPDDLLVYFARYLELVTGSDDLLPDLIRSMEQRFGEPVEDFEFPKLVESLDQPLLVLHSDDDTDVPIEGGRFVAEHWPGGTLRTFSGLGHRRILRDEGVVAAATEFIAGHR